MAGLEARKLKKSFGAVDVIHEVDLKVGHGEFTVFVGPSGCGKSTLLRLIAGLETPTSGQIFIGGQDQTYGDIAERGVAMVFQSYALYPHMTVRENISFALTIAGISKTEIDKRVNDAATALQLDKLLDRKPRQLSGGQRQRVAIGRAIVRNPDVFLFDEPLSNLDAELRVHMRFELSRLHRQLGATMIYVTHDQVEAMTLADKIVVLRAGRIEQIGAPMELYHNPTNTFVAGFIGSPKMNFLNARARATWNGRVEVELVDFPGVKFSAAVQSAVPSGSNIVVGIRPEHLTDAQATVALPITVSLIEELGRESFGHTVLANGEILIVQLAPGSVIRADQPARVYFSPDKCFLFDKPTGARL